MQPGEVVIVPYRDGPYLVRGPFELRDQSGAPIDVRRRTIALCRCGKSRTRPFCDGTHRVLGFKAPSHEEAKLPRREEARRGDGLGRSVAPAGMNRRNGRRLRDAPGGGALIEVRHAVRTARAGLELAAEAPCSAPAYSSVRSATTLLAAMEELLNGPQRPRPEPDDDWRRPCICLTDGALDAIAQAGEAGADVAAPANRVVALSKLLRREETE